MEVHLAHRHRGFGPGRINDGSFLERGQCTVRFACVVEGQPIGQRGGPRHQLAPAGPCESHHLSCPREVTLPFRRSGGLQRGEREAGINAHRAGIGVEGRTKVHDPVGTLALQELRNGRRRPGKQFAGVDDAAGREQRREQGGSGPGTEQRHRRIRGASQPNGRRVSH